MVAPDQLGPATRSQRPRGRWLVVTDGSRAEHVVGDALVRAGATVELLSVSRTTAGRLADRLVRPGRPDHRPGRPGGR